MSATEPFLTGDHKAQLYSDAIHATVVVVTVVAVSILLVLGTALPSEVAGVVFGNAIGYAAGRAGNVTRSRSGDPSADSKAI